MKKVDDDAQQLDYSEFRVFIKTIAKKTHCEIELEDEDDTQVRKSNRKKL